ncbi:acyl-CoA dehydrogenase family protein [Nocardioides sp. BP30]|uniref:acyl-CoA dehydrogenase family protein n=1 Tax=Nocardioides sp. BP30 TaxID=3036374 RepID=UPI002469BC7C|nr:acyl-CoA dehydrogenase family protein [Nocardioides sp. BP30]WGL54138.1 acyl-CoA dehydrogenase family protein [Nocardioides sp. BP30]
MSSPTTEPSRVELDEFRAALRAWLPQNLDRRGSTAQPQKHSPEHISEHRAIQRRVFDGGYAGITWPSAYGGAGLTPAHQRVFDEEGAGFVTPDFGLLSITTFGSCVPTMLAHATPEYLRRHVPRVLRGEELWCQFFSEPAAGSDLAGIRTRARRQGEDWVLDGAKIWSSMAHLADWGMCLARTDVEVPKHQGLTWFAIPTDAEGLTVSRIRQITGESEFCEETIDAVVVPDSERIGEIDRGWGVTNTLLVFERGAGRPGGDEAPDDPGPLPADLVSAARRGGGLADATALSTIASVHAEDYAVRQLKARIAVMTRLGTVSPGVASYGKLAVAAATARRGRALMEVGGLGAVAWTRAESDGGQEAEGFLASKAPSIAGGTEQMQRNGVAERVLGLPREPAVDTDIPFRLIAERAREWTR